jgi:hypothetical protein
LPRFILTTGIRVFVEVWQQNWSAFAANDEVAQAVPKRPARIRYFRRATREEPPPMKPARHSTELHLQTVADSRKAFSVPIMLALDEAAER